ncbi:MAG: VCBS repeat-containing protein, partial [Ignavibacteria bacterium]|nr:VCBS repeat-containing protein [Ignavibacteria bacterium]
MKKFYIIFSFLILISNLSFSQTPTMSSGFPKNLDNKRSYSAWSTPLIADLNRDGQKEIIVVTINPDTLRIPLCNLTVTKSNGESFPNFPKVYNDTIFTLASGDINQDGFLDIVMRANSRIYAIDRFGNDLPGFPVQFYDRQFSSFKSVSLYDLDGDGKLEIIASQRNQICVFNNLGQIKPGWPRSFTGYSNLTPGIADLDNDGKGEIVLCTFKHLSSLPYSDSAYVRCYKHNGENFSNNWPIKLDSNYGFWEGSPSIYVDKNNPDLTFILVPSEKYVPSGSPTIFRTCITKYGLNGNIKKRLYQEIRR